MRPPPVGDTVESAMGRTLLAVKSLSGLNVPMSSDLLGYLTCGSQSLKCGAPADNEDLDVPEFKKTRLGALEPKSMKGVEVHNSGNLKGDNSEEQISKRLRRSSMAGGGSPHVTDEMVGRLLVVSK